MFVTIAHLAAGDHSIEDADDGVDIEVVHMVVWVKIGEDEVEGTGELRQWKVRVALLKKKNEGLVQNLQAMLGKIKNCFVEFQITTKQRWQIHTQY